MLSLRYLAYVVVTVLLLAGTAACSSPVASEKIAADTHAGDSVASGFYDGHIEHDGEKRTYTVYIPPSYDGDEALPLIVALHGGFGTGKKMEELSHLSNPAASHGYIVAYPDGISRAWNAGDCCGPPQEDNADDVGFIADMVSQLAKRYSIDTSRVYGTGFSNGAFMVHRIACDRPKLFAAIAAVSGGPMMKHCDVANQQPVSALFIQGTKDPRIPFDGGTFHDTYRLAFHKVVDKYADRDSCSSDTEQTYSRGDTTCHKRESCAGGSTVEYCEVEGGGHQWPGGKTVLHFMLGDNTDDYNASRQIVSFFDDVGSRH